MSGGIKVDHISNIKFRPRTPVQGPVIPQTKPKTIVKTPVKETKKPTVQKEGSNTYFQEQVTLSRPEVKTPPLQDKTEVKKPEPEKPKVQASQTSQATAIFSSSGGYILSDSVQLPNKLDLESGQDIDDAPEAGDADGAEEVQGGKVKSKSVKRKGRKRNLKSSLQERKTDLRGAVSGEIFSQIDEPESVETSLARFKRVRSELKKKPVTK